MDHDYDLRGIMNDGEHILTKYVKGKIVPKRISKFSLDKKQKVTKNFKALEILLCGVLLTKLL